MAAIVKKNKKALGTYIPVSDYIMWKPQQLVDITVPSTANTDKRIDAKKAYYNNDSSCCYSLSERLGAGEKEDIRENVSWNRAIGANIITSDDTDSIDHYFKKTGELDKIARPNPQLPDPEMRSTLAWGLKYNQKPVQKVKVQAWGGDSSTLWGGKVCLWDNPDSSHEAWLSRCGALTSYNEGYNDYLKTSVAHTPFGDAVIQIFSEDGEYCLSYEHKPEDSGQQNLKWVQRCSVHEQDTFFKQDNEGHLRNVVKSKEDGFISMRTKGLYVNNIDDGGMYYPSPYGALISARYPDSWSEWKIDPVKY